MKKINFLIVLVLFAWAQAEAKPYHNESCKLSFDVPEGCQIFEFNTASDSASFVIKNQKNSADIIQINFERIRDKNKVMSCKMLHKNLKHEENCIILHERPWYDMLRNEVDGYYDEEKKLYFHYWLKAKSMVTLWAPYPLSENAEQVITSLDNHSTFRGKLSLMRQNAGSILMTIILSLTCFFGFCSRGNEHSFLYILGSIVLMAICALFLWQDIAVMCFVLGILVLIWLFFFSHNKWLIWIIDSIFD